MTPEHASISLRPARKFCILDCPARTRRWIGPGAARPTAGSRCCARRAPSGLAANLELMTTAADAARRTRPALPAASRLAHRQRLRDRRAWPAARPGERTDRPMPPRSRARSTTRSRSARCTGRRRTFPRARSPAARDGSRVALGSVALPASAIAGANGAGDAFAAGMLYALHEQWPIGEVPRARRMPARRRRCARCRRRRASRRSANAWRWRRNGAFGRWP